MLVDKDIRNRKDEIFQNGFNEENLGCISYDIRIGKILRKEHETDLILNPGEFVMVQSEEEFCVPKDLAVIVGEKNSLMRTGLIVNGPTYFPGHHTKAYLRVLNASNNKITNVIKLSKLRLLAVSSLMARSLFRFCRPF